MIARGVTGPRSIPRLLALLRREDVVFCSSHPCARLILSRSPRIGYETAATSVQRDGSWTIEMVRLVSHGRSR